MDMCENCMLYGLCGGRCGDTDPNYYADEAENEERESRPNAPSYYYGE